MTRTFSNASVLKTAFLAAVGVAMLAAAAPAAAASAATDAFVANLHPHVDFLDQSSRLAVETSGDAKVRAFARDEVIEQTRAGDQLVAWTQTRTQLRVAAPLDVAAGVAAGVSDGVTDGVDGVLTGRSVAIDAPVADVAPRTAAPGTLLPSGETDMTRLSDMNGRRFDAFYKTTQRDALRQLATLYANYMRDGDDPALRAMAARQLPVVKRRLAQLSAM